MADLLLLCRHAKRDDGKALAIALENHEASPNGLEALSAVVEVLSEALAVDNVRLTGVRHAPSPIATQTAAWFKKMLASAGAVPDIPLESNERLEPARFMKWQGIAEVDSLVDELAEQVRKQPSEGQPSDHAILVVGHMPQLGWLASRLMGNSSPWTRVIDGNPPPLALENGEVAAIVLTGDRAGRPQGHLEWTVAPGEQQTIDDLRDKIKSKMEVAKLLGAFMTLVLGGVVLAPGRLDELSRGGDRWAVYLAAISFLVAIGLYLRAMYAYDSLLMPNRFWGESMPGSRPPDWLIRRPPSGAAWVLYQNMLHIWTFLFTPATIGVAVGLLALAYAALEPGWFEGLISSFVLIVVAFYAKWHRPVLGSQD